MFSLDRMTIFLMAILVIYWIFIIFVGLDLSVSLSNQESNAGAHSVNTKCSCADVFDYGVKGSWVKSRDKPNVATANQRPVLSDKEVRKALRLHDELHRDDFRCGFEFPIPNTTIPSACNASTEQKCCSEHTGWCGGTSYHCENPKSSDFSKLVSSNEAVWKQSSNKCKLKEISKQAACDLLNENQFILIFIGDSEARKTLKTLLMFLNGDFSKGILHKNIKESKRRLCRGEKQILSNNCRQFTHESSVFFSDGELCDYKTSFLAEYYPDFNTFLTSSTRKRIETLHNIENAYILLNSGYHFNANPKSFIQYYLRSITELLRDKKWPKLIVETLPKTPSVIVSDQRGVFQVEVSKFCKENGINVFDNFQLSDNLMPYDGKLFRLPFYLQKIKILLNFLAKQADIC